MQTATEPAGRVPEIDWLKGLAILGVLCIHARLLDGTALFEHAINRAVYVFLVLVGVNSELWWQQPRLRTATWFTRTREWYRTRLLRLLVPVWVFGAVWWLGVALLDLPEARQLGWQHALAGALGYMPWVGTTWFVTLVLQLVLLFPLLRALVHPHVASLFLFLAAASTIASNLYLWEVIALARRLFGDALGVPDPGWYLHWIAVPRVFWHVIAGAFLARALGGRVSRLAAVVALVIVLLGVPLLAWVRADAAQGTYRALALVLLLDVPLTLALLGLLRFTPLPRPVSGFLGFCGRASFGIYLGHVLVDEFIHKLGIQPAGEQWTARATHALILLVGGLMLAVVGGAVRDRVRWQHSTRDALAFARGRS